jgi:hypothetical protein
MKKDPPIPSSPKTILAHKNEFHRARKKIRFNIELNRFQSTINNLFNTNSITPAQRTNLQILHNEVRSTAENIFSKVADDVSSRECLDRLTCAVNKAKNSPDLEVSRVKCLLNELINQINILLEWIGFEKIEPYVTEAKKIVLALRPEAGVVGFFDKFNSPLNKARIEEYSGVMIEENPLKACPDLI